MILSVDEMHYLNRWKTINTVTAEVTVYVVTYVHLYVNVAPVHLSFPLLFFLDKIILAEMMI